MKKSKSIKQSPQNPEVRYDIHASSFFFKTPLSQERIQQIITFFNSLTPDQQQMMNEYREDGIKDQQFNDDANASWA